MNHCGQYGAIQIASPRGHRMPVGVEAIDAAAREKQHAVLHDVRLDERQRRARIVGEDVHRHVGAGRVGDEHLQPRVRIAEERRFGDIALVPGERGGRVVARERLVGLREHQQRRAAASATST